MLSSKQPNNHVSQNNLGNSVRSVREAPTPFLNTFRIYSLHSNGYRYAFNGMERDDEWNGTGNAYDFGLRIYNSRLGRFLSRDPRSPEYPWQTPYAYHRNSPIAWIDYLGGGDPPKSWTEEELEGAVLATEENPSTMLDEVIVLPQKTLEEKYDDAYEKLVDIPEPEPNIGRGLFQDKNAIIVNGCVVSEADDFGELLFIANSTTDIVYFGGELLEGVKNDIGFRKREENVLRNIKSANLSYENPTTGLLTGQITLGHSFILLGALDQEGWSMRHAQFRWTAFYYEMDGKKYAGVTYIMYDLFDLRPGPHGDKDWLDRRYNDIVTPLGEAWDEIGGNQNLRTVVKFDKIYEIGEIKCHF